MGYSWEETWESSGDLSDIGVRIFMTFYALMPVALVWMGGTKLRQIRLGAARAATEAANTAVTTATTAAAAAEAAKATAMAGGISGGWAGGGAIASRRATTTLGNFVTPVAVEAIPQTRIAVVVVTSPARYASPQPSPIAATAAAAVAPSTPNQNRLQATQSSSTRRSPTASSTVSWTSHKSFPVCIISLLAGMAGMIFTVQGIIRGHGANMNRDVATLVFANMFTTFLGIGRVNTQAQLFKLGEAILGNGVGIGIGGTGTRVSRCFSFLMQLSLVIYALGFPVNMLAVTLVQIYPTQSGKWVWMVSSPLWIMSFLGPGSAYIVCTKILKALETHKIAMQRQVEMQNTIRNKYATATAATAATTTATPIVAETAAATAIAVETAAPPTLTTATAAVVANSTIAVTKHAPTGRHGAMSSSASRSALHFRDRVPVNAMRSQVGGRSPPHVVPTLSPLDIPLPGSSASASILIPASAESSPAVMRLPSPSISSSVAVSAAPLLWPAPVPVPSSSPQPLAASSSLVQHPQQQQQQQRPQVNSIGSAFAAAVSDDSLVDIVRTSTDSRAISVSTAAIAAPIINTIPPSSTPLSFMTPTGTATTPAASPTAAAAAAAALLPSSSDVVFRSSSAAASAYALQMSVWQSKLVAINRSLSVIACTIVFACCVAAFPWLIAHLTYTYPMSILPTTIGLIVAVKQAPTQW